MTEDKYHIILKQYWGYDDFRGIQQEIIHSIGSGKDTLGLMPTGGGKSIAFQVPALAQEGICIVITPLIALMKDQVENLKKRGIKAAAIYSGLTHNEILVTLENCIFGDYKFLYVSPERLSSELFLTKLKRMRVSFITVDEAHCISQWGYDFRPSYIRIADLRKVVPQAPVLALTATATPEVVKDIQDKLLFRQEHVFKMSFARKNLAYVVRHTEDKESELLHIINSIPGTVIVYCRSRKECRDLAAQLEERGLTATFYHAGLSNCEKDERQRLWQTDQCRVMVATNAFGMGIDKPDVRLVVHMDVPDSPEAYFQEAGRAGRDGRKAYAVLLYNASDKTKLMKRIPDTFPDREFIKEIYEHICYYYQMAMGDGLNVTREFNLNEFCRNFKHFPVPTDSALRILTRAGYLEYIDEQENDSRLIFLVRRDELYHVDGLEPEYESLLQAVLRSYGGVFSDYITIDETLLGKQTGLSRDMVYRGLIALGKRRIISYIPYKKTPYIRFAQKRVETERIVISREIYENRKEKYEARIQAMIDYATRDDLCRSRMLLAYFGETSEENCLACDVCLKKNSAGISQGLAENVEKRITALLREQKEVPVHDIDFPGISRETVGQVLHQMVQEEKLLLDDGMISLSPNQDIEETTN
ncbi:ATP-dependent DNA helicase RecQ [Bacteroides sp. OF04-15BH]|uniref:RecQ family ATP-dependent DNA helicase n=1 Tax=Bacteroides sp. OF04-15BH TaxID=2292281 RepID=UPI000E512DBD|nr:ATP-dependent DNA helicase RecQ [Bacteroides sp. OF04-15BH]RHP66256.1 RecQ family ATP-dependent DNA helicase [Bacteroides sp. OF04-15BH]